MPKSVTEKLVECSSPGGMKLCMERWYYEAIRAALMQVLPDKEVHAEVYDLHNLVHAHLDILTRDKIDSLSWHVAWVCLDLRNDGVIKREAGWLRLA